VNIPAWMSDWPALLAGVLGCFLPCGYWILKLYDRIDKLNEKLNERSLKPSIEGYIALLRGRSEKK